MKDTAVTEVGRCYGKNMWRKLSFWESQNGYPQYALSLIKNIWKMWNISSMWVAS